MERIRKGNTFHTVWEIMTQEDNTPYNLAGRQLSLYLTSPYGKTKIEGFTTEGNEVRWTFEGKDQQHVGPHTMTLVENEGRDDMRTVDVCNAFELVHCSHEEGGEGTIKIETVHLSSVFGYTQRVDQELDKTSPYAIANMVVASEFEKVASEFAKVDTEVKRIEDEVKRIEDEIGKAFDPAGYYPDLTVGMSDNLVGRGESVPAEFSFRASGGKSIKDGTARIKRLKGNSVVWNQGFPQRLWSVQDGTLTIEDNTYIVTPSGEYPGIFPGDIYNVRPFPTEKVLVEVDFYSEGNEAYIGINLCGNNISDYNLQLNTWQHIAIIATCDREDPYGGAVIFGSASASVLKFKNMRFHNLTKMFGAGNEPTTIEEYNARKPIVADEYAYNEGEVIHMTAEGIKSIGDNAWDEEWEKGVVWNGIEQDLESYIRSKNYIKVIPNQQYYYYNARGDVKDYLSICYYDNNKSFVEMAQVDVDAVLTIPANIHYIRFYPNDSYGDTYTNDITISLYHSGWKAEDAKYQPYWEDRLMFDKRIKDEFPDGMSKWDKVYNKNGKGYIVHGLGVVKIKDLSTRRNADGVFISSSLPFVPKMDNNGYSKSLILARFTPSLGAYSYDLSPDNQACLIDGKLWMNGQGLSAYANAQDFVNEYGEDVLYYELAEPTIIEYDEPFNLDYEVADFGTEEIISDKPSAPIKADIIYQFNAVDMIRDNYNEILQLKTMIATMQAQLTSLTSNNGGQ